MLKVSKSKRQLINRNLEKAIGRIRSVFPAHLQTTPTEWRALKRQEWLEVMQALDRYHQGSAFTPAQSPLYKLGMLSRQIQEALQSNDWVAW